MASDVPPTLMVQDAVVLQLAGLAGTSARKVSSLDLSACGFPVMTSASGIAPPSAGGFPKEPESSLVSAPSSMCPCVNS
jgi:hypothetical protein